MPEGRVISPIVAAASTARDATICLKVPDTEGGWVRADWAQDPEGRRTAERVTQVSLGRGTEESVQAPT